MNFNFQKLEKLCNLSIKNIKRLSGGDINDVYLLHSHSGNWVIKLNNAHKFSNMFEAEAKGLKTLAKAKKFKIPKVVQTGIMDNQAFLIMEYIPEGNTPANFSFSFAEALAELHRVSHNYFGFYTDNYIGSLPQYNRQETTAASFYIRQRLEPQLQLALEKGYSFPNKEQVLKNIANEIPNETPALIHGDLWSGNYLISQTGQICLIDPAVSYGPREMDLAMMQLFGGFPSAIFQFYHDLFPLPPGYKDRVPLWQFYYLLVHLNPKNSQSHLKVVKNGCKVLYLN